MIGVTTLSVTSFLYHHDIYKRLSQTQMTEYSIPDKDNYAFFLHDCVFINVRSFLTTVTCYYNHREFLLIVLISSMTHLTSILANLRRCVNHPKQLYLKRQAMLKIEHAKRDNLVKSGSEYGLAVLKSSELVEGTLAWQWQNELKELSGEALISASGKLAMLDRLLIRLKKEGSRVLIFRQWKETLDILEEYFLFRFGRKDEVFFRLDGDDNAIRRELNVRSFNDPQTKSFAYLISTKAGGMGINLSTADAVILYDSSYNPQIDLQVHTRT
jgi:SNF2 family DNA or RNA helicase